MEVGVHGPRSTNKGSLWYRVSPDDRINGIFRVRWALPDTEHYVSARFNGECLDQFTRELKRMGYQEVV